jgi:hypothetical protein
MSPLPEVPDSWSTWDLPILTSIVARYELDGYVGRDTIVDDTGLDVSLVERRARDLRAAGWFGAYFEGGGEFSVNEISEAARRTVGAWPSPERAADRLLAAVERAIEQAATPEERGRLVKIRDGLAGVGRDLLVNIGSAIITGQM